MRASLALLLLFTALRGVCHAQPPVRTRIEVESPDETTRATILTDARAKVRAASATHVLVEEDQGTAERFIRFRAEAVQNANKERMGVVLAILLTRSPSQGEHDILWLRARFVPVGGLKAAVEEEVARALE
ncbi:MAG TPA: hypothetical protein VIX63_03650 [Vicinamibacterales bacterium]